MSEKPSSTLTINTPVSVGLIVLVIGAILSRDVWIRDQNEALKRELRNLRYAVDRAMTIEDAQNWTDEFRDLNAGKGVFVPNIQAVIRKRNQPPPL
jgi:hypothetical protein